jgi:hypothetical protein
LTDGSDGDGAKVAEFGTISRHLRPERLLDSAQIQYEAVIEKRNGKKIEFIIKADGTLDSIEEPVMLDELPSKVADTVKKAIGEGKVEAVEKVTKDGTATYEVGCTLKSF